MWERDTNLVATSENFPKYKDIIPESNSPADHLYSGYFQWTFREVP